ncbi:hypothetical protein AAC387_Pa04g1503 [Persea americana]
MALHKHTLRARKEEEISAPYFSIWSIGEMSRVSSSVALHKHTIRAWKEEEIRAPYCKRLEHQRNVLIFPPFVLQFRDGVDPCFPPRVVGNRFQGASSSNEE